MENLQTNREKNKNKLRTIYPKNHEKFKKDWESCTDKATPSVTAPVSD